MERLSKGAGWILALCFGLAVGCDSGAGTGSASASGKTSASSTKPATSTTTKASSSGATTASAATTTSAAAGTGSAKADGPAAVTADDLAKADASDDKGVLSVDLSKADQDAPALGGGEPPAVKGDAKLEWLPTVGLEIPNPGWKKSEAGEIGILAAPSDKGGVVFAHFGTPEDGLKKVDELTAKLQLKNMKWAKPTEVAVGPDKLPGYAGGGHGEDEKGKPVKVFYALIKSGEPQNLLALGGADEGAEEEWKTALDIIDSIRKKK